MQARSDEGTPPYQVLPPSGQRQNKYIHQQDGQSSKRGCVIVAVASALSLFTAADASGTGSPPSSFVEINFAEISFESLIHV